MPRCPAEVLDSFLTSPEVLVKPGSQVKVRDLNHCESASPKEKLTTPLTM